MQKEKLNVALASVLAAVFLTSSKLIIGILTGSLGILSEALHSGLDMVAAVITYFSVSVSDKPADQHQARLLRLHRQEGGAAGDGVPECARP